jgi:hypothetical protein
MNHSRNKAGATALAVAVGAAYGIARWPRMTNWGATPHEAEAEMPGDEIIGEPKYRTTHAVTIDAPVERVWPWLVQIGQGRAGLYSYDWLENLLGLDVHSADRIVPEHQDLSAGDVIRLVPEDTEPPLRFVVARVDAPYLLVLGPGSRREEALASNLPYPCWTFRLGPVPGRRTRLVVRFQSDFKPTPLGWLMNKYALEPLHFMMERKMLLGIKERAEGAA